MTDRDGWSSAHTAIEIVCDDMPFLVDSITMELNRQDAAIDLLVHPVMRVVRHDEELVEVVVPDQTADGFQVESVIHVDVARQTDPDRLAVLRAGIEVVLEEVRAAVEDWGQMRARTTALATELRRQAPPCELHLLEECEAFLDWLSDDNFTYLGYREYELQESGALDPIPGTGLGILRGTSSREPNVLRGRALDEARSSDPLVLTKANSKARVHRPSYLDYVGVKRFAADGRVVGERRFLGLYTSTAYRASPRTIPRLRDKVEYVLELGGFPPDSHDAKGLIDILESLPRDLLVEIDQDDLFDLAIGILGLGERPRVRLFVSPDRLDRFVACTLCLPRDRFNTDNRVRAGKILARAFGGTQVDWRLHLSESVIVRVDYIVRCPDGIRQREPVSVIESRITEVTRSWSDELRVALNSRFGEHDGVELFGRFGDAFRAAYRAECEAPMAIADIARIDELHSTGKPVIAVYRRGGEAAEAVRCRVLSAAPVSLSDVVPKFEHMDVTVVDERPYEITPDGADPVWVYDFGLRCDPAGLRRAGTEFSQTFLGVWIGELEDDRLNALVMLAGLSGRQITIIRAVLRYLRQATTAFSDRYMISTLLDNPAIAVQLVELFSARFDPDHADRRAGGASAAGDHGGDRRGRQPGRGPDPAQPAGGAGRDAAHQLLPPLGRRPRARYLSFKLDPTQLDMLPLPRPQYEIFVYSPRVEGIHLRGGRVARGGLRWSDRLRGLPDRGAGADEGPDGQERADRPGRLQGRLRRQARRGRAGSGRPRGVATPGDRVLPDVPARPARPHRQLRRRRGGRARAGGPLRRRRSVSGGRRRQGHGRVLGYRQRRRGRIRLLVGRCVRVGWLARLRPQADGDHRPRRLGIGQAPLPRARHRHPGRAVHGRRDRRHVRRRVRQRDALLAAHPTAGGVQPRPHLSRPRSGPGRVVRRAAAAVRARALVLERLRPSR